MPELPDITIYVEALAARVVGQALERVSLFSPFLLRTADPPIETLVGHPVTAVSRLGKRIVIAFDNDVHLVMHLMIAGRLRWTERSIAGKPQRPGKIELALFGFARGDLRMTEAGSKKRAALHIVRGIDALAAHDPGGIDPFTTDARSFEAALRRENHTLKRALTDPHLFSGIGNAYSDEILHAARLSPITLTSKLLPADARRLFEATHQTLITWTDRLRRDFAGRFPGPGEITAFRPDFAVHGRFGMACPACGGKVQRIRYADNETNYCPTCQTGGVVLADRSLSRLLKGDWHRLMDERDPG